MKPKQCDYVIRKHSNAVCQLTARTCVGYKSGRYENTSVDSPYRSCAGYNLPKDLAEKVKEANLERQKSALEKEFGDLVK